MNKLRTPAPDAIAITAIAAQAPADDKTSILAPGFVYEDIYKGNGMISLDFDPTGAMYVTEKQGRVLLFEPKGKDFKDPVVILDIRTLVNPDNESGLLGIAIDPQFSTNHYVYVFYTTSTGPAARALHAQCRPHRLDRRGRIDQGLSEDARRTTRRATSISGPGDPDSLYVTAGNDADPDNSPVDDLEAYNGKVLRVNKADGRGFADNPFSDKGQDLDAVKSRIWA